MGILLALLRCGIVDLSPGFIEAFGAILAYQGFSLIYIRSLFFDRIQTLVVLYVSFSPTVLK